MSYPWGGKDSDMTERLTLSLSLFRTSDKSKTVNLHSELYNVMNKITILTL